MDEAALGMVSSLVGCKVIHLLCNSVRYAGAGCVFLSGINWYLKSEQCHDVGRPCASVLTLPVLRQPNALKVCHELLGKAWEQARTFVHSGFGIPSKKHMLRMLRHTCEHQVHHTSCISYCSSPLVMK